MKTKLTLNVATALLSLSILISQPATGLAQNTVVTYQGRVQSGGSDFTGAGQFKFALVTVTNTAATATATATISGGFVTIITVTFGGNGYVTPPAVTIAGTGGSGATATASISGGAVTSITVNNPGSGYAGPPTVTIAPAPANLSYTSYWSNDGTSSAGSEPVAAVGVAASNGLFTARLGDTALANMAALGTGLFTQPNLQLRLWFNDGVNGFAVLQPAQPLTAAPYAFAAGSASNLLGSLPAVQLSGAVGSGNVSGTYGNAVTFNHAANSFSGSGAGLTALNAAQLTSGTVPDARLATNLARTNQVWLLGGNAGTTAGPHFLGTTDNQPLEFKVNGLRALRLEDNGDSASDAGTTPDGAPNVIGGSPRNFVAAGVVGATIAGGGATNYFAPFNTNSIRSDFGVIGGGSGNAIAADSPFAAIAGGFANDISTNSDYSTIGGGYNNDIAANSEYATIAGGYGNDIAADSEYATIAGGANNDIGVNSFDSTIGGGNNNNIEANSDSAIIAGGEQNDIGTNSAGSTLGGGFRNNIAANSTYATIPGGVLNGVGAGASYALAAGRRAQANHPGAFVWADSTDVDFASTATNQFSIRAAGGVRLDGATSLSFGTTTRQMINLYGTEYGIGVQDFTVYQRTAGSGGNGFAWFKGGTHTNTQNNPGPGGTVLMTLGSGGLTVNGTFVSSSDRNVKQDFAAVDSRGVLDKVARLPIQTWAYKNDPHIKHLGPVAQDFYAAFAVGPDDKHIATVDADGVALAAIQGLNQKLEETRAENAELKARLERLENLLNQNARSKD